MTVLLFRPQHDYAALGLSALPQKCSLSRYQRCLFFLVGFFMSHNILVCTHVVAFNPEEITQVNGNTKPI